MLGEGRGGGGQGLWVEGARLCSRRSEVCVGWRYQNPRTGGKGKDKQTRSPGLSLMGNTILKIQSSKGPLQLIA